MKKGDERRSQILACAEKLFYQKGYENTSIQDILQELKCSKGGFYHHFDSKLQLLEAITAQRTLAAREELTRAVQECPGDAVERLNVLFARGLPWRAEDMEFAGLILRVGYRDGSLQIRECVKRALLDNAREPLERIIQDGIEQKLFYTRYPEEIGELLLAIYANINDEIAVRLAAGLEGERSVMQLIDRLDACRYAVEQLLGAPYGSVVLFDPLELPDLLRRLSAQARRQGDKR